MTREIRIDLIIISLILCLTSAYWSLELMAIIGKWFMYSIAICLVYIAIRGK